MTMVEALRIVWEMADRNLDDEYHENNRGMRRPPDQEEALAFVQNFIDALSEREREREHESNAS
jgi:hypothetical protein